VACCSGGGWRVAERGGKTAGRRQAKTGAAEAYASSLLAASVNCCDEHIVIACGVIILRSAGVSSAVPFCANTAALPAAFCCLAPVPFSSLSIFSRVTVAAWRAPRSEHLSVRCAPRAGRVCLLHLCTTSSPAETRSLLPGFPSASAAPSRLIVSRLTHAGAYRALACATTCLSLSEYF